MLQPRTVQVLCALFVPIHIELGTIVESMVVNKQLQPTNLELEVQNVLYCVFIEGLDAQSNSRNTWQNLHHVQYMMGRRQIEMLASYLFERGMNFLTLFHVFTLI